MFDMGLSSMFIPASMIYCIPLAQARVVLSNNAEGALHFFHQKETGESVLRSTMK